MNDAVLYSAEEVSEQLAGVLPCECDDSQDEGEPSCIPCYVRYRLLATDTTLRAEIAHLREGLAEIADHEDECGNGGPCECAADVAKRTLAPFTPPS